MNDLKHTLNQNNSVKFFIQLVIGLVRQTKTSRVIKFIYYSNFVIQTITRSLTLFLTTNLTFNLNLKPNHT